ncbi:hypothetical protein GXP67_19920 [Rhodocytophaga rosea]|uniref:Uncharacterized protein n=1 Tax=Rhodocytophaga rosea TaxID=2704465 RepID=A0A6C0GKZ6_9BACT|nr:hypothetical protein [Rhodocytophaga rosea]QHT68751.1 hypothetical protein GXP67_19920 [Rhodocytophaga rosea]
MSIPNPGYDPSEIKKIKEACRQQNQSYILNEEEPQGDEFAHFLFTGTYEGQEVIFDSVLYTLRLHHSSVLYEMAEDKTAEQFPNYTRWDFEEDANGELVLPEGLDEEAENFKAEVMAELEDSDAVKVKEYVNIDTDFDYGVALEACLHVEEVTGEIIEKFVNDFKSNRLVLDTTLYSFKHEEEEED